VLLREELTLFEPSQMIAYDHVSVACTVWGCGELTKDELPVHLHEFEPPYISIWIHHLLLKVAFVEVVFGGVEWGGEGQS
jgi:hypothetical protein